MKSLLCLFFGHQWLTTFATFQPGRRVCHRCGTVHRYCGSGVWRKGAK